MQIIFTILCLIHIFEETGDFKMRLQFKNNSKADKSIDIKDLKVGSFYYVYGKFTTVKEAEHELEFIGKYLLQENVGVIETQYLIYAMKNQPLTAAFLVSKDNYESFKKVASQITSKNKNILFTYKKSATPDFWNVWVSNAEEIKEADVEALFNLISPIYYPVEILNQYDSYQIEEITG